MKKLVLMFAFLTIVQISFSQNWSVGQYYANRGEVWTEWQNQFTGYYDYYGNPIYQRYCRQTQWYSEYRSGYYYVWNGYQWISQWYEGTQWYCTWSGWYAC